MTNAPQTATTTPSTQDVLIVGGGPAGLSAALAAKQAGAEHILILEREDRLGGILNQCIHNGFGLTIFREELTGPEYALRYIRKVEEEKIPVQCDTMVLSISPDKVVTCMSPATGLQQIQAKSIILAMGCRERPRGALNIPGYRPSGILSAGTAQRMVNLEGQIPGKKVLILGSGDIGLIMARRMTFEGCEVVACVELMPYSSGLTRNIVQCLDDFSIPLLLSHTVVRIHGRERLTGVTVAEVDADRRPIPGTEKEFDCDTLLLSVGLIPENELSLSAGVTLSPVTNGPIVDQQLATNVPGIFAAGNVLHVHDLVDFVSQEAEIAGKNAAAYAKQPTDSAPHHARQYEVLDGEGVMGCVPQQLVLDRASTAETVRMMFRPRGVYQNASILVTANGQELYRKKHRILVPGEMEDLSFPLSALDTLTTTAPLVVSIEPEKTTA